MLGSIHKTTEHTMTFHTPDQLILKAAELEAESANITKHLSWFEDELTRTSMRNEAKHLAKVAATLRALAAIRSSTTPEKWGSSNEVRDLTTCPWAAVS
jgi:hypothetical protein